MSRFQIDIPRELLARLDSLMPGEILTIIGNGERRFVVVEEDEFNLLMDKAGFERQRSEDGSGS